ncbi:unnamed protein product [Mytilus edulis]|uniref:Uncharacterized protein n=1 Tax=Mytilus edulis TaxID=6550 RepID=A0A8S3R192_MYTED|nr:unnamed protein product [Mytilus edulis]
MIVGKESAGKTCLLRRLLKEDISDVTSTDGVDIVVRRCKINIEDGKWIIGKEIDDDKVSRIRRALNPNAEEKDTQICSYRRKGLSGYQPRKKESSSLIMPEDLMSNVFTKTTSSKTTSNLFALSELWDFAGQKEFYATHQAFLTSSAVYLVVADMKDDISKQGLSQCFVDFQDIGAIIVNVKGDICNGLHYEVDYICFPIWTQSFAHNLDMKYQHTRSYKCESVWEHLLSKYL